MAVGGGTFSVFVPPVMSLGLVAGYLALVVFVSKMGRLYEYDIPAIRSMYGFADRIAPLIGRTGLCQR